jgi:hypothetical protein
LNPETSELVARLRRSKPSAKNQNLPTPLAGKILLIVLFVGVMAYVVQMKSRKPIISNVCSIDGQLAEWSKRQGRRDCEYGHFSVVEKTAHTWSAACP